MVRMKLRERLLKQHVSRKTVLFVTGLFGIGYVTVFQHTDRPYLFVLLGSMIGLPAFMKMDEANQEKKEPPQVKKPPVKKAVKKAPAKRPKS